MNFTIKKISNYLGMKASAILADEPFKNWAVEKSVESSLNKPRIDFVFTQNGIDFVCDENEFVRSIFLYADESRHFKDGIDDLPFTLTRQQVIERLGSPSKSGGRISDPILGEYGAWDRFTNSEYVIHIEYRLDADVIVKITIMRVDIAP